PMDAPYDPNAPLPGPPVCVIGCGNLLRGDDAAGPILIRRLWDLGTGEHTRLVDGGTAGMDVAFQMRGAERVILIDACTVGDEPGTLFRVPGDAIADLPAPTDIHSHSFRWDHALAFARWLLKDQYPSEVEVWLIEAESMGHGAPLTEKVAAAVEDLAQRLARELEPEPIR
ncbi:MAG: hydrogenase maturation protease, partial [Planctomycetota bacterium]